MTSWLISEFTSIEYKRYTLLLYRFNNCYWVRTSRILIWFLLMLNMSTGLYRTPFALVKDFILHYLVFAKMIIIILYGYDFVPSYPLVWQVRFGSFFMHNFPALKDNLNLQNLCLIFQVGKTFMQLLSILKWSNTKVCGLFCTSA